MSRPIVLADKLVCFDTILNAVSIEWCPNPAYCNYLVCGTYQLQENCASKDKETTEDSNTRLGSLFWMEFNNSELTTRQQFDCPGILDAKWCPFKQGSKTLLATADAEGKIRIIALKENLGKADVSLENLGFGYVSDAKMALSLDWTKTGSCIAASDSGGNLHIMHLAEDEVTTVNSWHAHQYEAWITAWDYWNPHILYSGGDDCKFMVWDTRKNGTRPEIMCNEHSMGVTSIRSNHKRENIIATGSYDEHVILWDVRFMNSPLGKISIGGGIWRLKWEPKYGIDLLAACMHNGFHIIDCKVSDNPTIRASYMEHSSLAYGVDWKFTYNKQSTSCSVDVDQIGENGDIDLVCESDIIGSCSFYDHSLHIWQLKNL